MYRDQALILISTMQEFPALLPIVSGRTHSITEFVNIPPRNCSTFFMFTKIDFCLELVQVLSETLKKLTKCLFFRRYIFCDELQDTSPLYSVYSSTRNQSIFLFCIFLSLLFLKQVLKMKTPEVFTNSESRRRLLVSRFLEIPGEPFLKKIHLNFVVQFRLKKGG